MKNRLYIIILASVLGLNFFVNPVCAQKQKYPAAKSLLRKEFHPEEGSVHLRAIQLGKEGVLLTSETYKIEKGESRFHYDIVNTDLQIVKENVLSVDRMVIGTGMTQKAFLGKVNYHHLFYGRKNFILHTIPRSGLEEGTVVEGSFPVEGIVESVSALPDKMVLILRPVS